MLAAWQRKKKYGPPPVAVRGPNARPPTPNRKLATELPLHLPFALEPQLEPDDLAHSVADARGDEGLALVGEAADDDMTMERGGVLIVDPRLNRGAYPSRVPSAHELPGEVAEVTKAPDRTRRDHEPELAAIIGAAVEEVVHIESDPVSLEAADPA
jgi:hypothetical protein